MTRKLTLMVLTGVALFLNSCTGNKKEDNSDAATADKTKETFPMTFLVEEDKKLADSVIALLNAQHHQLKVLERRMVPGPIDTSAKKYYSDYAVKLEKLPVINPGPG